MSNTLPTAVLSSTDWSFQNSYVERLMDHSALTAAHPDDTLILAGPPRFTNNNKAVVYEDLLPLGMVQNMQITSQNPVIPAQAIGSGRYFYLVGKANHGANIARLFVKGKNLARALYQNAILGGIDPNAFDDKASFSKESTNFLINMDSELFRIPFGLAVFFRDKIHNSLGALYMELCLMTNWSLGVTAGQSMIMENVNLIADRVIPINPLAVGQSTSYSNYDPKSAGDSAVFKAIFQGNPGESAYGRSVTP